MSLLLCMANIDNLFRYEKKVDSEMKARFPNLLTLLTYCSSKYDKNKCKNI